MLPFCLCLGMAEIGIKNMVSVPVGMSVHAVSLAEVAYFVGTSIDPELALTACAQLMILSSQPNVGVKYIAMKCLVSIERDAFTSSHCFLGCCSNVMEFGVGTCGVHVGWQCSCRWGGWPSGRNTFCLFFWWVLWWQGWCPAGPVLFW